MTYHGYVVVLFDEADDLVELVLEIVNPHVANVCALACIVIVQEGQLVFVVLLQKEGFCTLLQLLECLILLLLGPTR